MTRSFVLLSTLASTLGLAGFDAKPAHAAPTVAPLSLPPISEETLANGLSVVVVEKRGLPLVALRLVIPAGSARDPKNKDGLASFTGQLLRRGTKTRSAEQIEDTIERIGGLLGIDSGIEATAISATVPAEHTGVALDVLADLVQAPAFPKKEFDLAKRRELSQLKQDLDDPSTVAERALIRFIYGPQHPYGHPSEGRAATVKSFTLPDVQKFHKATYTPQGAFLIVVGEIKPADARELAAHFLGGWKGPALPAIVATEPAAPQGLEILLVDKPDATQAQIRASTPGFTRHDPAFHAATVANTIVGGGFTSRLVDEVRVNRGLSYSVSTRLAALRTFGAITYSTFTKTETVREILDVSFKVLDDFAKSGPTQEEVEKARRYVIGLYPSRVESIDQLAEALASARLLGLPFSSIASYRDDVARVETTDAAKAALRYPGSKGARVVIVGRAADIRQQLKNLGTLSEVRASDYE